MTKNKKLPVLVTEIHMRGQMQVNVGNGFVDPLAPPEPVEPPLDATIRLIPRGALELAFTGKIDDIVYAMSLLRTLGLGPVAPALLMGVGLESMGFLGRIAGKSHQTGVAPSTWLRLKRQHPIGDEAAALAHRHARWLVENA